MITVYDRSLFCVVIVVSVILMIVLNFCVYSGTPACVVIEVDGKIYAEYNLNDIKNEKIIDVVTEYGTNKILLTNSDVKVIDASCGDKIDVMSKPITKPNQMIVCIPNHFTVRITGGSEDMTEVDKVAY